MNYSVKLDAFEGPLDILLGLIEKEKLNITEISLAQVTDQYLDFLKSLPQTDPEILSDFLVVAAQLILIKSKNLLPQFEITSEEEMGIQELQIRLKELQLIKEGVLVIKKLEKSKRRSYGRDWQGTAAGIFYPPSKLSPADFPDFLKSLLKQVVSVEKLRQETLKIVVSFEAKIKDLRSRMQNVLHEKFSSLVVNAKTKAEVIVTFLAMLELVRQKLIVVEQSGGMFSDINIHKNNQNAR